MPNVSIIMGVYNCKNYNLLRKSVESILQQTYKDYEFIICNDGSTNNTLEELKKIAQSDSRIKIISYEKMLFDSQKRNRILFDKLFKH